MLGSTFVVAAVLILLGVGFYVGSGMESLTPLIPAAAGVLFGLLGALASLKRPPWLRPAAMHAAMVFAVLAFAGTVGGVRGVITLIQGGEHERPLAPILQSLTAVIVLVYLVLGIRSFLAARRARASEASSDSPAAARTDEEGAV